VTAPSLVPDPVRNPAHLRPEQLALVCGDRTLTYGQLHDRANRLGGALLAAGLGPGDRLGLLAPNTIEYLEVQLAAVRTGIVFVPLNFRLSPSELAVVAADAGLSLLLHTAEMASLSDACGDVTRWSLGAAEGAYESRLAGAVAIDPPDFLAADAVASIVYTSGTTGRSKGVVVTNAAVDARIAANVFEMNVRPGDVLVQTFPMFHIAINMPQAFLWVGGSVVIMPAFDPVQLLPLVAEHRATHLSAAPTMLAALLEAVDTAHPSLAEARRTLRLILYGGSAMPARLLARVMELLPCEFVQSYGSTESGTVSTLRSEDHIRGGPRLASAGRETPGQVVRIMREDGTPAEPGERGELLARAVASAQGYYRAPELTEERFAGGWVHTGDIAYRDEDGYLFVVDRTDDMIVTGGENVYPREVEEVLYAHPAIVEAAVVGVADPTWVQRVHAVVVVRVGEAVTLDELDRHCRARLAGYKVPRSLEVREELPKSAAGKILRRAIRESAALGVSAALGGEQPQDHER
jgi:long-chain acyl-CoA synthetase